MRPRERSLANVERFATIPTIRRQNVTTHSFYCAVLAPRVASMIRWKATFQAYMWLNRWALMHDMAESITGDLPTPLKKRISGLDAAEDDFSIHFHGEYKHMVDLIRSGADPWKDIHRIVKFVDSLEATMFLVEEQAFGNQAIEETYSLLCARVRAAWYELPFGPDLQEESDQKELFRQHIEPLIDGRRRQWPVIT